MNTSTPPTHGNAPSLDQALAAAEPAPIQINAGANERLAQMHAEYADAKAQADAAAKRLKDITDGIKRELTEAAPGAPKLELLGPHGPTLRLSYVETTRTNTKAIKPILDAYKVSNPDLYATFTTTTGSWVLKAVAGGTAGA